MSNRGRRYPMGSPGAPPAGGYPMGSPNAPPPGSYYHQHYPQSYSSGGYQPAGYYGGQPTSPQYAIPPLLPQRAYASMNGSSSARSPKRPSPSRKKYSSSGSKNSPARGNLTNGTTSHRAPQSPLQLPQQSLPEPVVAAATQHECESEEEAFDEQGYIDSVKQAYHSTDDCPQVVVHESLPYATVKLQEDSRSGSDMLDLNSESAPCFFRWTFRVYVTPTVTLKYVSFLCQEVSARKSFTLLDRKDNALVDRKVVDGDLFLEKTGIYRVGVEFKCSKPGIYKQWVCFDVTGQPPYLVRQLHVFVGDEDDPAFAVEKFRFETVCNMEWNPSTVEIVESDLPAHDREPVARQLLARWKPLGAAIENDSLALRTKTYGPDNYKSVMHGLIRLEEGAMMGAINRIVVEAPIMDVYQGEWGLEGFLRLGDALDPHTKLGAMTLKNSSRMLLAFQDFADVGEDSENLRYVYEADIIARGNGQQTRPNQIAPADYDIVIRVYLSPRCVKEQHLKAGKPVTLHQARFQSSRLLYAEWHDTVEKVYCWNVLFPSIGYIVPRLCLEDVEVNRSFVDEGLFCNQQQLACVKSILAKAEKPEFVPPALPPVIIQGAFGTGKTFTMAQAIKCLLLKACQGANVRMILCTMSNSAADLYIQSYFAPFMMRLHEEGYQVPLICRIYKTMKPVKSIDDVVLKYCRTQQSKVLGCAEFAPADTSVVNSSQLIISNLAGIMDLGKLCLPKSTFTHIFMDEAAQAFEADALKALSLAGPITRVVMAGDPRQMAGGTIQCQLLRRYGFDRTLIERLAKHYDLENEKMTDAGYGYVLQTNYRCHPDIMEFTRAHFYPEMTGMKNQYQCAFTDYYPFRFVNTDNVPGVEQFHQPSASYYNYVEAVEIQQRVIEMIHNWPPDFIDTDELGNRRSPQSDIVVIAASDAQVSLMQQKMREQELTRGVNVSHVSWIQGLEYRAVFISTARTLKLNSPDEAKNQDLTFLSDRRLLNTAITRAKSVVVVVGSERTLTTVGSCQNIWLSLIKACKGNSTHFQSQPTMRSGRPVPVRYADGYEMLQSRFDKVSVIPDPVEKRLMYYDSQNAPVSNTRPRFEQVPEEENVRVSKKYPKLSRVFTSFVSTPKADIPWKSVSASRLLWLKVVGQATYLNSQRQGGNLKNDNEVTVVADLIRHLIPSSRGEILVVCLTNAQAIQVKHAISSVPRERVTLIDFNFPLPRQSFAHVVMSLVKTGIKNKTGMEQESSIGNRVERASKHIGKDLCDIDQIASIMELASDGCAIFVGNHFTTSVHPAWDWIYRRIGEERGVFDDVKELAF